MATTLISRGGGGPLLMKTKNAIRFISRTAMATPAGMLRLRPFPPGPQMMAEGGGKGMLGPPSIP